MTTLVEHIIIAGAENRPSMLEKSMYDSWASRIHSGLTVPTFQQSFKMEESPFNNFKEDKLRVLLALETEELLKPQGETMQLEKLMLAKAQEAGHILDEVQLAFIADPEIAKVQVAQQTIPQNSAFQTKDLDVYDSNYDDISSAKVDVQEMPYSKQTNIDDYPDNEINNFSNIIPYSQYLQESQDAGIQDTNSFAPNDLLVLTLVEQMTDHVANLDKEKPTNKMVNESLILELERYKE
nr:hypothetical protein [Tanacetum cinerariifolium]